MNHSQWKTLRTKKLLGETADESPACVEAGYALALGQAVYDRPTPHVHFIGRVPFKQVARLYGTSLTMSLLFRDRHPAVAPKGPGRAHLSGDMHGMSHS